MFPGAHSPLHFSGWTWLKPKAEAEKTGFHLYSTSQRANTPVLDHRVHSHPFDQKGKEPVNVNGNHISTSIKLLYGLYCLPELKMTHHDDYMVTCWFNLIP
jgi:hypothetical protein